MSIILSLKKKLNPEAAWSKWLSYFELKYKVHACDPTLKLIQVLNKMLLSEYICISKVKIKESL